MLPRVLEGPVSSGNILQCPEAVKRSGMVRAEVNRISSHSHHRGTCSWLWCTGGALGHLWCLPSGCAALPFNISRGEEEEAFIGPKEGIWHNLHEHIWWAHDHERESCPGEALWAFGSFLPCSRAPQQYPEGVPAPLLLPVLQPEPPRLAKVLDKTASC